MCPNERTVRQTEVEEESALWDVVFQSSSLGGEPCGHRHEPCSKRSVMENLDLNKGLLDFNSNQEIL